MSVALCVCCCWQGILESVDKGVIRKGAKGKVSGGSKGAWSVASTINITQNTISVTQGKGVVKAERQSTRQGREGKRQTSLLNGSAGKSRVAKGAETKVRWPEDIQNTQLRNYLLLACNLCSRVCVHTCLGVELNAELNKNE